MPYLTIDTNSNIEVTPQMLENAVDLISTTLGKPKNYIVVKINTKVKMIAGATTDNIGALIEMKSIGFGDKKPALAKLLTDFCVENLNADARYVSIHFLNMAFPDAAQNGNLFG